MQKTKDELEQTDEAPDYELFSFRQVIAATIFGSVIGGGLMLGWNYTNLGNDKAATRSVLISILVFVIQLFIGMFLIAGLKDDDARIINVFLAGIGIVGIGFVAKNLQGDIFNEHLERGGKQGSNLNVATICLLVNFVFLLLFLVGMMLSS